MPSFDNDKRYGDRARVYGVSRQPPAPPVVMASHSSRRRNACVRSITLVFVPLDAEIIVQITVDLGHQPCRRATMPVISAINAPAGGVGTIIPL